MSTAGAAIVLSLCFGADELGTRIMLRAGGQERMIRQPAVRISLKIGVGALYLKRQKRQRWVRWGVPALYCGAGAWDARVAAR